MDVDQYDEKVVKNSKFKENPHEASEEVWEEFKKDGAFNTAIMRTSILGIVNFEGKLLTSAS